jgi:hypothetical protein
VNCSGGARCPPGTILTGYPPGPGTPVACSVRRGFTSWRRIWTRQSWVIFLWNGILDADAQPGRRGWNSIRQRPSASFSLDLSTRPRSLAVSGAHFPFDGRCCPWSLRTAPSRRRIERASVSKNALTVTWEGTSWSGSARPRIARSLVVRIPPEIPRRTPPRPRPRFATRRRFAMLGFPRLGARSA